MDKLIECKMLMQTTQQKVISSPEEWKSFLRFAAQIYKYDFTSAILIYAQRPDATALASLNIWNSVGRRVNAGAKGVPILLNTNSRVQLSHVFDVSDTHGEPKTFPVPWQLSPKFQETVLVDLEDRYGVTTTGITFDQRIQTVIEVLVQESYNQYASEILNMVEGTELENVDYNEIDAIIQEFLSDSITQMVFSRIAPKSSIVDSLIFDDLPLLTNPAHVIMLGTACVKHSGLLLRQIESSIKQIEHEQNIKQGRSQHVNQIQRTGRPALSPVSSHPAEIRQAPDKIRDNLQELSGGNPTGQIRDTVIQHGSNENLSQERGRSEPARREDSQPAAPTESVAENGRYNGDDSVQQLAVQDSRRADGGRCHLQEVIFDFTESKAVSEETAFSVAADRDSLNGKPAYHAFVSEQDFRDVYLFSALTLRNSDQTLENVQDFFITNPSSKEAIDFLKDLHGISGGSITFLNGNSGFYMCDGKGLKLDIRLPEGDYSKSVSWSIVQKEIRELIAEDRYLSRTPATHQEQLSLFGGAPVIQDHIEVQPTAPVEHEPAEEAEEEFLNFDPAELKRTLQDPEHQKHVDEMLRQAETIYQESRKELFQNELVNFHYPDLSEVTGGQKTHYKLNIEAIRLLKQIESDDRPATPEEQSILSKYVGWGGISQAFDSTNASWQKEYQDLKGLLSAEEYEAARASTLTAFYTPPAVISAIHSALKSFGLNGGNVLDPACGTGRFFGYLPADVEKSSRLFGVELDDLTGRIAQQLNQKNNIQIRGFEKAAFPDNFFDVSFGNVPFGDYKIPDKRYDKQNFLIHDYFFARAIDKTRPGGMIVFVTSKGTLDKANSSVRKYIAQRAELIGAIRLPNTAMKTEANTEVTSDIIFLKKRERMVDIEPDWINLTYTEDGVPVNTYFVDHPEMMLGTMAFDDRMYGSGRDTTLIPHDGKDWREELTEAISYLQAELSVPELNLVNSDTAASIPADPAVKNFSYTISEDNKIYYQENSQMVLKEFTGTRERRIRGMIEIRDAMREVIRVQSNDYPEEAIQEAQSTLNRLYDSYVRKNGSLIGTGNRLAFSSDSGYPLLCSLENIDDDKKVTKAAIFTKRTIRPPHVITHVDTAIEALPVCLNQKGCVDIPFMSMLTDKSDEQIIDDLTGIIFKDPIDRSYLTAEEYLSGNVRDKLSIANNAADNDKQYLVNVEALSKVQPKDLDASQIDIRLGSPLLETEDIKEYIFDTLNPPTYARNLKVIYVPSEALWKIDGISHGLMLSNNVTASKTFGTHRIDAYALLELSLNQKTPTIRDRKPDDTYEINPVETAAAREKQKVLDHKFENWIFSDPERRERLVRKYNDVYNNIRLRQYDGNHLTFPGMNPEIKMQTHQSNAVARILSSGNTLLAHCVGAGKTYEMIAAAMETKRLGLCNKSMFVVPGHLIDQWGSDILKLYPGANVLVATKQDFERSKRQRLISRIATGDYDAVIIANTSFEKIPISSERRERIIKKQILDVTEAMELAQAENGEDWTIKQMERTKKSLEDQLERLSNQAKKDDLLTFEELGIDQMFIDEAHYYKNRTKRCA